MKKTNITLSIALAAVFSSSVAFAEPEVTGKIIHESAKFTSSGIGIGAATTRTQTADSHGKNLFKTATQAKIFIDGDLEEVYEGAAYHVEINAFNNSKNTANYDNNEPYTQRDALREAYIDVEKDDISYRIGKQQVVWGTADGMKLLDNINPTDYSEMAQNQMEDSRIPVWMLNAETETADGGSFQFVLSQAKGNKIAGLNPNGDQGNAFVMKGVDTISGKVNGFFNLAPALGKVAYAFDVRSGAAGGLLGMNELIDDVKGFATDETATSFVNSCQGASGNNERDTACLHAITNTVSGMKSTDAQHQEAYNLVDTAEASWDPSNPDTMFEYLHEATFLSFDAFVNMTSEWRKEYPKNSDLNIGGRYKGSTADGLNYSLNFINHYDPNPYVGVHWENQSGTRLYEGLHASDTSSTTETVALSTTSGGTTNSVGGGQGARSTSSDNRANLVFTEKLNRINTIGGSFDYAMETEAMPIVLRGEFTYDKDVKQIVVTRIASDFKDLEHGFVEAAFQNKNADFLKYVLGADITVLTNMMVSGQFIQIRNLDHVDTGGYGQTTWQYTADQAVMHLSNNLQKAAKNKEFVSLFLSKPFGASGEHRWNNILMLEDGGGRWNRLDAEFSIDDDTQATVEWNKYFGDENTQFGQLAKSSNIQVGVKYSF